MSRLHLPPPESDDSCLDDSDDDPDFLVDSKGQESSSDESNHSDENNSSDSEEKRTQPNQIQRPGMVWKAISSEEHPRSKPEWLGNLPHDREVDEACTYFEDFFDDEIFELLVDQSNLYAIQKDPNKPLSVTRNEMEQFVGICMYMSIYNLPRTKMYWSQSTRIPHIADIMSRNRFLQIKASLHMNNNNEIDLSNIDRLYKVRPFIENLKRKFNKIPMEQNLCVDEQIVPFKGRSSLRQYNPKKPHKWGYKIFVLCDEKGIIYDFDIYTGKIEPSSSFPDIGASSNVVLKLSEIIPKNQNHYLFFDNWFSSPQLFVLLQKIGIFCLGTIRLPRFKGLTFISDKEMKKKGRGTFDEKEANIEGCKLRAVKWFDNKPVTLVSSFSSAYPTTLIQRFDKKTSKMSW